MSEPSIVLLAALMGAVTYTLRVAPFLVPIARLPEGWSGSLRLMGPATLASVAAAALWAPLMEPGLDRSAAVGLWAGTGVCVAVVALRRNISVGLVGALVVAALLTMSFGP
jgi:branched-subunit amino acid transport protein